MNPIAPAQRPVTRPLPASVTPVRPPSIPPTTLPAWTAIVTGPKSKGTGPRHAAPKPQGVNR